MSRRVAALLGAVAVLSTATAVLAPAPAQAAGLTGPTYDKDTRTVTATATRSLTEGISVTLKGPGGTSVGPVSRSGVQATSVTVSKPGVTHNGVYTVIVDSTVSNGDKSDTVSVMEPPTAPGGVEVSSPAPNTVTVSWNRNGEPDMQSYEVLAGGEVVATADAACEGRCTATVTGVPAGSRAFVVRAQRLCPSGPACSNGRIAATSGSATTDVADAPGGEGGPGPTGPGPTDSPGPSPSVSSTATPQPSGGTGSPSASASPGASGSPTATPSTSLSPGALPATRPRRGTTAFGGFSGFGSALAVPGLGGGSAPTVAGSKPAVLPDGTYDPELAYDSEIRETEVSGSGDSALGPIGDAVDSEQLMRTLAAALILLLAGAHLRRWLTDADAPRP